MCNNRKLEPKEAICPNGHIQEFTGYLLEPRTETTLIPCEACNSMKPPVSVSIVITPEMKKIAQEWQDEQNKDEL